jgi:hypothetical protein
MKFKEQKSKECRRGKLEGKSVLSTGPNKAQKLEGYARER